MGGYLDLRVVALLRLSQMPAFPFVQYVVQMIEAYA